MSDKIRFGILSFAHYHANFWAEALNDSPDAELTGIWDDNVARGKEAAHRHNTRFWADRSALLAESEAVGITSETIRHADLVVEAAEAGRHILLEKPMARNLEECRRMQEAVRKAGIVFMQNFPKRYDPVNHEVARLVHSGELGTIALARVRHANYHLLELGQSAAEQWFGDPELAGGGALLDEGIHAADLLLWLLGEPQSVFALTSRAVLGLPLEDTALAIFSYPNGVLAELATSGTLIAAEESVEVYGTGGSAIISGVDLASRDFTHQHYLKVFRRHEPRGTWQDAGIVPYFKQGIFHQQGPLHFLRCLQGEAEPIVGFDEGWKSLAMIEAAYRSTQTGCEEPIDYSLSLS